MDPLLWLGGFPSPVLEFFIVGVVLFLIGAVTLGTNIEDVSGIEQPSVQRTQPEQDTNLMED
ncbi:hypothetical protein V5735_22075 (plasmid) [Haladaptatus sp. SPP-AMP-3]|uniref:hypothetical protein n=1 Tax=Haladaptatus sp. SPP-AMP-3 TaxID=3121295 RepID=UPI003C2D0F48